MTMKSYTVDKVQDINHKNREMNMLDFWYGQCSFVNAREAGLFKPLIKKLNVSSIELQFFCQIPIQGDNTWQLIQKSRE